MHGTTTNRTRLAGLGLALFMGLILLLLSFTRLAGDARSAAFGDAVLDSVLAKPLWGTQLGRNILLFILALLVLHAGFALLCWLLAHLSRRAFPHANTPVRSWTLLWFCMLTLWLLISNAALFPHSSLGAPYSQLVRAEWLGVTLFITSSVLAFAALATCAGLALWNTRDKFIFKPFGVATCAAILLVAISGLIIARAASIVAPATPTPETAPHVILIGIDSLRTDMVRPEGSSVDTPNIDGFLAASTVFSDAITPLARTFPSWVSLVTGRHPHTTGAIINLLPRDLIGAGDTLGDMFRRKGYQSFYAIDEVRFSNLDGSYGFDRVISPPMGASDFLIGWFSDAPLLNIMTNTPIGAWLFPYSHANRGIAVTYSPDEFVRKLGRNIDFRHPTFLAIHLTLPHWPFSWADSPALQTAPDDYAEAYNAAIQRVDRQFADIISLLERRGGLSNTIVMVFSDHGEALGLTKDFLLSEEAMAEVPEFGRGWTYGHGSSVLSPYQYKIVLGLRNFGSASLPLNAGTVIDAPVSLVDVAPTLAELLHLDPYGRFDGQSLLPLLNSTAQTHAAFEVRARFTETEFNPRGFLGNTQPSTSSLERAALYYQVDPVTDRLELRRERVSEVLNSRQYAAILEGDILAALPTRAGEGFDYLFVSPRRGILSRPTSAADADTDSTLSNLWSALHARFTPLNSVSPQGSGN